MSMATRVQGYRDSKEFDKHMNVLKFCRMNKVSLPRETAAFFGDDSEGVDPNHIYDEEVEKLLEVNIRGCIEEFNTEMCNHWEIDIKKLPPEVTKIRFTNSY